MNASKQKRISIATCWASTRTAVLDGFERYEDSYAITQEFREWITSSNQHPEHLEASVLKVPKTFRNSFEEEVIDSDEALEI